MEEVVNEKMVDFIFQGGQMGIDLIKAAINKYLELKERHEIKVEKKEAKKEAEAAKKEHDAALNPARGKMSLDELMKQNAGESRVDITDKSLKSFDRIARKYHVDYAVIMDKPAKDAEVQKPTYHVIFKARDNDVMNLAFKEYVRKNELKNERKGKSERKNMSEKSKGRERVPIKERIDAARAKMAEAAKKRTKSRKKLRRREQAR